MFDRDADWAAIPHLGAAIGVFTPHAWMAIDQLRRVVDVAQVGTFLLNRGCEHGAWGEKSMYGKKVTGVIRSTFVVGPDGAVVRGVRAAAAGAPGPAGCGRMTWT